MTSRLPTILIDFSGTLHIGDQPTTLTATEAVSKLRSRGFPVRFVTNTTKESCQDLLKKVRGIGFDIREEEIFTSLIATKHYINQHNLNPFYLLEPSALQDLPPPATNQPFNAVVVGLSPSNFHYEKLTEAMNVILSSPNTKLIAIHKGKYLRRQDESLAMGPGPFIAALEYACSLDPSQTILIGKPNREFFEQAIRSSVPDNHSNSAENGDINSSSNIRAIMIGDDVNDDIVGAQKLEGVKGILVKTGKYREGDEDVPLKNGDSKPWKTVDSFSMAVDILLREYARKA